MTVTSTPSARNNRFSSRPTSRASAIRRTLPLLGGVALLLCIAGSAFASSPVGQPTITAVHATFRVPVESTSTWTLRLWSGGGLKGSATGTAGVLTVATPVVAGCAFQADVRVTAPDGHSSFYSGSRATVPLCGEKQPTQTIAGHIYRCTAGSATTTEVPSGTLAVTGTQTLRSQPNPVTPTAVTTGDYTMTAAAPSGFAFVICGGAATVGSAGQTATQSVTVPAGGAGVGLFYVTGPPVAPGGGANGGGTIPAAAAAGSGTGPGTGPGAVSSPGTASAVTPAAGSQLAFTGMDTAPPLVLGLALLALGALALVVSRARRLSDPVRTGPPTRPAPHRIPSGGDRPAS